MKISKDLPQFNGDKNLLAIAGKQEAKFFIAHDGTLSEIGSVKTETPRYTDREGFFARRGNGRTLGTGSVYENKKEKIIGDFLAAFSSKVKELGKKEKFKNLVLFVPSHISNLVRDKLPKSLQQRIILVIKGNYLHKHPFDLLKKLKSASNNISAPKPLPPASSTKDRDRFLNKIHKAGKIMAGAS